MEDAVAVLSEYRKRVREQMGEAVHTGLRKGADGGGSAEAWRAISKCTTWGDAIAYALWGLEYGLEKRLKAADAIARPPPPPVDEGR